MEFKTRDTIVASLRDSIESRLNIDLTEGTSERDLFVEAPIEGQLLPIWTTLEYLYKLQAPFTHTADLLEEDLDVFCKNNNVHSIPATYSTGEITFYTYSEPAQDITITSSDSCETDSGTSFTVNGYYNILYENRSNYYNATLSRWEITCAVIADESGTIGDAGQETVINLSSTIDGIDGCINNSIITGGTDEGSIFERLELVKRNFSGRSLSTVEGIKLFVENYVDNVTVVGSNDLLMLRTGNIGGGIDIYVRGESPSNYIETIVITSTGLITESSTYTGTTITLKKQPATSIDLFVKNDTTISNSYFSLEEDDGLLAISTRCKNKLVLTSTGVTELGEFVDGDTLEIRYTYNSLLETIEKALTTTENIYNNRDILLRGHSFYTIDIAMNVKLYTGYTLDDVTSSASTSISTYIESVIESYVELADVVALIKALSSVDNIDLTTAVLTPSDGRTATSSGDIIVNSNEYAKLGTVTFTEWTA